jgi:hypothetical protein
MQRRTQLLIRNIAGGVGLLALLLVALVYFGVFESAQSDEAQIRSLIDNARTEINDHNWDRVLRLCDLTPEQRTAYREAIPRQANFVHITAITPEGFISVPEGATEYSIDVLVIGHMEILGREVQRQRTNGTMYFVKRAETWLIDLDRTSATFPFVPRP